MLSIISTVGTAIFGRPGTPLSDAVRQMEASGPISSADVVDGGPFPGEDLYRQALALLRAQSDEFLRRASPELNAIAGIHAAHGVSRGNQYAFLASQTYSGALAARVLADFCRERYEASHVEPIIVHGLQVQDPRAFRLTGLPYLVQTLYRLLDDARRRRLIPVLNATAGFKAAIPYITLVGMIQQGQRVEVSCIHEFSSELITLAGLPVTLDLAAIERYADLLEQCDAAQEAGFGRAALASGLGLTRTQLVEDHPLWSLFEQYDSDHYILSGLGSIALAEIRLRRQPRVYLSREAEKYYSELDATQRSVVARQLDQMANRDWRQLNQHATRAGGDKVLKAHDDFRLVYFEEANGDILIARIARHSDRTYDTLPDLDRAAFGRDRLWEGSAS